MRPVCYVRRGTFTRHGSLDDPDGYWALESTAGYTVSTGGIVSGAIARATDDTLLRAVQWAAHGYCHPSSVCRHTRATCM